MMETKICGDCKKEFPKTEKYFRKRSDGNYLRSNCISCFDKKSRERHKENYKNNTEKEKQRHKYFYYRDLEYTHQKQRKTYLKNIERVKKYDKNRINELTDSIIKNRIVSQTSLNRNEIPKELIETKRLLTQLKRTLKNGK